MSATTGRRAWCRCRRNSGTHGGGVARLTTSTLVAPAPGGAPAAPRLRCLTWVVPVRTAPRSLPSRRSRILLTNVAYRRCGYLPFGSRFNLRRASACSVPTATFRAYSIAGGGGSSMPRAAQNRSHSRLGGEPVGGITTTWVRSGGMSSAQTPRTALTSCTRQKRSRSDGRWRQHPARTQCRRATSRLCGWAGCSARRTG